MSTTTASMTEADIYSSRRELNMNCIILFQCDLDNNIFLKCFSLFQNTTNTKETKSVNRIATKIRTSFLSENIKGGKLNNLLSMKINILRLLKCSLFLPCFFQFVEKTGVLIPNRLKRPCYLHVQLVLGRGVTSAYSLGHVPL